MNEKFSDERISAYLDDELSADARAEVERELAENTDLRQAVEELRALRAGLQALPRYRLDTSIAERVLQLAEREILLGSGTDDKPASIPVGGASSAIGDAAQERSSPSHAWQSAAHVASSESRFSWRTLAWSASAAAVAAIATNFYHVGFVAHTSEGPSFAAAEKDNGSKGEEKSAARFSGNSPDSAAGAQVRSDAALDETGAAKSAAAEAMESLPLEQSHVAKQAGADKSAVDGSAADAMIAEGTTLAPNGEAQALADGGLGGGNRPGDNQPGDGESRLAHDAGDAPGANVDPAESAFASEAARAMYGGTPGASDAGVSFVVLEVSPDAWQDRAFDKLLLANRVVMLGDSGTPVAASGVAMRSADKQPGEAHSLEKPRENREQERSADVAATGASPRSDVVVADLTQEQLDALLAAVGRSADFARAEEFSLAEADAEIASIQQIEHARGVRGEGGGGRFAAPDAAGQTQDSQSPDVGRAAPRSLAQGALERTDSTRNEDKVAGRGDASRGFGSGDRSPGAAALPNGASRGSARRPARTLPDALPPPDAVKPKPDAELPEEEAAPPKDAPPTDTPPKSDATADEPAAGNRQANKGTESLVEPRRSTRPKPAAPRDGNAAASAERKATGEKVADGDRAKKEEPNKALEGEAEETAPAEGVAAGTVNEKEPRSPLVEQAPAAGYARRVSPRSVAGDGEPTGGLRSRRATIEPAPAAAPADLPAPADAASDMPAPGTPEAAVDAAPRSAQLDNTQGEADAEGNVASDSATGRALASAPRVRVIFLLRPTHRGPAASALAAPADAAPATQSAPPSNAPPVAPANEAPASANPQ